MGDSLFLSVKLTLVVWSPSAERVKPPLYVNGKTVVLSWSTMISSVLNEWLFLTGSMVMPISFLENFCLKILLFKMVIFLNIFIYFVFFVRTFKNTHLIISWWPSSSLRTLITVLECSVMMLGRAVYPCASEGQSAMHFEFLGRY